MNTSIKFMALCALMTLSCTRGQTQSFKPEPSLHFDGFRGPNRDGNFSDEKGLLKQWPEAGPQLLWETEAIGKGYSSPVVVGDRLYVTGMSEDQSQEVLHAFSLDGKLIYSTPYGKPFKGSYPETRTTPTINNGKAYVISGMGDVVCINCKDGKIVWNIDGLNTYASTTGNWGTAECPLVFDNKVIYSPGGNQTTVVALNKDTGKEIWKSPSINDKRNYTQPALINYKGKKQIVGGSCNRHQS